MWRIHILFMFRDIWGNGCMALASAMTGIFIGNSVMYMSFHIKRYYDEKRLIKWDGEHFVGSLNINDYDRNIMKRYYSSPTGNTKVFLGECITLINIESTKKMYPNGTTAYYHQNINGEIFVEQINEDGSTK